MNILIAGGTGFLGRSLTTSLRADDLNVVVLTRHTLSDANQIQWDGRTPDGWGSIINEMDTVVHLTRYGLEETMENLLT